MSICCTQGVLQNTLAHDEHVNKVSQWAVYVSTHVTEFHQRPNLLSSNTVHVFHYTMEIGTLSPDGHYEWDGGKWVAVGLTKVSDDGFWIWNGSEWVPNTTHTEEAIPQPSTMHVEQQAAAYAPVESTSASIYQPYQQQSASFMMVPQAKKSNAALWIGLAVGIPIAVAIIVVLAGVMYVWASALAEEDQSEVAGTWYNTDDTLTLYPNGTVMESTGNIAEWSVDGYNITTTFLIEGDEYDFIWRYEIKLDSDGDRILFLAYYDTENGAQTNEIAPDSCVAYSDSVKGAEAAYFNNKTAIFPEWCDPADD